MSEPRDVRDLVGDEVPGEELERLRRVHELLVAAGPPPELSPTLQTAPSTRRAARREARFSFLPQRRLGTAFAAAVSIAAVAFGAGYFAGRDEFDVEKRIPMQGTALARRAVASIDVGAADVSGNVPMLVHVRGLPKLSARGYYTLYLTRNRKPIVECGTFTVAGPGALTVRLTVPYAIKRFDGWVVARERVKGKHPGPVVLTTFET